MQKLSHLVGAHWVDHLYQPVFAQKSDRVVATAPAGGHVVFRSLIETLAPPYLLLYVLHTPRGEAEPGRYQSPEVSADELSTFLDRFADFLAADARFDLWAYSPAQQATVVWDRHNQVVGYGAVESMAAALVTLGFAHGDPSVPVPHQHHYRAEYDRDAADVLAAFEWSYSPLQAADEQRD